MVRPVIDLTQLCEHELIELNQKIVERLRYLRDVRAHHQMRELRPGDRVSFSPEPGRKVAGTILRLNRKSVSLVATDGVHWRVAPALLSRTESKDIEIEVTAPVKIQESQHSLPTLPLRLLPRTASLQSFADVPRNAPCPCGSGKKFKRCCLVKTAAGNR